MVNQSKRRKQIHPIPRNQRKQKVPLRTNPPCNIHTSTSFTPTNPRTQRCDNGGGIFAGDTNPNDLRSRRGTVVVVGGDLQNVDWDGCSGEAEEL